jgi:hypothetical protein
MRLSVKNPLDCHGHGRVVSSRTCGSISRQTLLFAIPFHLLSPYPQILLVCIPVILIDYSTIQNLNFETMVGFSFGRKTSWQYSHSASIFSAVLLFTAGFLCTLLWTNDIVHTPTSVGGPLTGTFTSLSPAVSTFSITYQVVCTSSSLSSHVLCSNHLSL